jgi:hypothetical protein
VSVLLKGSDDLGREGHRLELLVPVENTAVLHTLALTGVTRLVPVHVIRPDERGGPSATTTRVEP